MWRTSTKVIHCVLDRFRTYKIALPPKKQIPRRGGSLTQINTAAKSFTGQFLRKSILTWSLLVIGPRVKASTETREMRKGQERADLIARPGTRPR